MRTTSDDQEHAAGDDPEEERRVCVLLAEADVELARDGEEEVQVDRGPDDRVEDLLDEVRGDRSAERAGRDDRDEHQERHERPEVGRQEAVSGDADGVGGDDRPDRHLAGVGGAEDPVVRDACEDGLGRLEDERGDQVARRDRGHLVPEALDPALDVEAEQLADQKEDRDPENPGADLDEPVTARARCGGLDCGGCAHSAEPSRSLCW